LAQRVTNCSILILSNFLFLGMLFFMNTYFPFLHIFPFLTPHSVTHPPSSDSNLSDPHPSLPFFIDHDTSASPHFPKSPCDHPDFVSDPPDSLVQVPDTSCQSPAQPSNSPVSDLPTSLPSLPKPTLPLRHSSRPKHTPSYLQDYHCSLASSIPPPNSSTMYPIDHTISYSHLSPAHKAYTLAISTLVEPRFYHEAVSSPHWCEAMDKELAALEVNHTWVLTALPSGKHLIGCKWVYNIKFKSDGSIERYKAQLVAKGYNQMEGIDYAETFSRVDKLVTIRCFVALAAAQGWSLTQLDVNNAFLHGDLDEEVFMSLPPSFKRKGGDFKSGL
jgi:hypothetical protein